MNSLLVAAKEVSDFMDAQAWEYCLIGGIAVQQWGEPRTTLDVDFTLLTGWGGEDEYILPLLSAFEARIEGALEFARLNRVMLLRATNGRDIDIALGALPFEILMMEHARHREFAPGLTLRCCSAEDLFIMKAFADRPRDWSDAASIVARNAHLDGRYILSQLASLCELKDSPEILARARTMLSSDL